MHMLSTAKLMTRFHYIFAVVLLVLLCLVHVHNVSAVQIIKTKTNNKDNLLEVSARVHTHANATAKGITDLFCSGCKAVDTLAQDPASAVRAHCQEREWHEAADILRKRTQVASTVNAGGEEVDVWHACTNQGPQIEESFQPGRGREIILFYFVEMMSGFLFNNLTPPPADQVRSELPAILALISASNSKTFTKAAISRLSQFTNEAVTKGYLSVADQKRFIGAVLAKPATGRGL